MSPGNGVLKLCLRAPSRSSHGRHKNKVQTHPGSVALKVSGMTEHWMQVKEPVRFSHHLLRTGLREGLCGCLGSKENGWPQPEGPQATVSVTELLLLPLPEPHVHSWTSFSAPRVKRPSHPRKKQHIFWILSLVAFFQAPPSSGIPEPAKEHHCFHSLFSLQARVKGCRETGVPSNSTPEPVLHLLPALEKAPSPRAAVSSNQSRHIAAPSQGLRAFVSLAANPNLLKRPGANRSPLSTQSQRQVRHHHLLQNFQRLQGQRGRTAHESLRC